MLPTPQTVDEALTAATGLFGDLGIGVYVVAAIVISLVGLVIRAAYKAKAR